MKKYYYHLVPSRHGFKDTNSIGKTPALLVSGRDTSVNYVLAMDDKTALKSMFQDYNREYVGVISFLIYDSPMGGCWFPGTMMTEEEFSKMNSPENQKA